MDDTGVVPALVLADPRLRFQHRHTLTWMGLQPRHRGGQADDSSADDRQIEGWIRVVFHKFRERLMPKLTLKPKFGVSGGTACTGSIDFGLVRSYSAPEQNMNWAQYDFNYF